MIPSAAPVPPRAMVMPHTPQLVITALGAVLAAAFLAYALHRLARRWDPRALLLLAGGAVCYLNEPIDDVLGLLWHPRPGQWTAVDTYGPAPLWGLFIYMVFFGAVPYLLFRLVERGVTVRQLWAGVVVFWVADVAVELPAIHSGLYRYYGHPALDVAGFPLYWLVINVCGPLATVVILVARAGDLRGARMLVLLLIPMTTDAAGSIVVGWPAFSTLAAGDDLAAKTATALLTAAIGAATIALLVAYLSGTRRSAPIQPSSEGRAVTEQLA